MADEKAAKDKERREIQALQDACARDEAGGSSEGSGSGNFGAGIDLTDRTETTTVAGILATNGNADVTVAGDTTLTGASITAQGGEVNLDTQSLTVTDLASSSLSLSAGIGGGIDASSIDGEDTETLEVLGAAQEAGDNAPSLNFELSSSSGTTTGGVGDGATAAGAEGAPTASEAASAVLSSLQQQIAAANEPGVSAEELTAKLGTLQASASTTAFEAQQAAADIFNEGDPASAEALEGLSPNQAVLMLQAARVWLTPDQQAQIDIAIQQIITGTEPAATTGEDDS